MPPAGFNDPLVSRVPDLLVRGGSLGLGGVVVVGLVGVGPAVDALVRDVVEGLEVLLVVLAGQEAFLDAALDRTAVEQAGGLGVLVASPGGCCLEHPGE